jgi:monoamine oxidase
VAKKKCIVIGAGLAGLAAAYRAVQKGWEVDVLEADDRWGGRVFTQTHRRNGQPTLFYELGGEWIGKQHGRMISLCKHFHLDLMDHRYSLAFWREGEPLQKYPAGAFPFSTTLEKRFKTLCKQLKRHQKDVGWNKKLDRIDWWTKLKEMGFRPHDLERRDMMDSTDFGESIRQTSAYAGAAEYAFSNKFDEMDKKIVGGNSRLSDALVDAIRAKGGTIQRNWQVVDVAQANGMVTVTTRIGKPLEGNACICAIPAPCLTKIKWRPALPEEQRNAAQELQYARIAKTAVLFPTRIWEKALPTSKRAGFSMFSSRVSDFCFESSFGQKGTEGIICSYAIGDKADDLANEDGDRLAEWISSDVCQALEVKPRLPAVFLQQKAWQQAKSIGGAYAFYRPDQWFKVRPALARPHGRVMFAGEHLSEGWQGFMEGAVETGEAAADAL